jgi:hypothetical protein
MRPERSTDCSSFTQSLDATRRTICNYPTAIREPSVDFTVDRTGHGRMIADPRSRKTGDFARLPGRIT